MSVFCKHNKGFQWHSDNNTFTKGYLFNEQNKLFENEQIIQYFDEVKTVKDFQKKLKLTNGFFIIIKKIGAGWLAAVDHIRSIPLFFARKENEISISDDAFYLAAQFGKREINALQKSAFLLSGHTLGNNTLIDNVFQLEAGQYLFFDGKKVAINDYYEHLRGEFFYKKDIELKEELDQISKNIFQRLIHKANGKQLVIPLSGGYDSRYIIAILKRLNYENIITYTYGVLLSHEVRMAKKVAEALNVKWHFIEYPKDWTPYYECQEYQLFASQLSSLPHEQDFLAIKELKENGLIKNDAIIVPGFCGDLLGGSIIPDFYQENLKVDDKKLKNQILQDQFCYENKIAKKERNALSKEIEKTLSKQAEISNIDDFINVNEWFFTKNKVSKYVVNSLRVYEYFGYEWSMPLWDKELIEMWYRIPNQKRIGENRLYNSFLLDRIFTPFDIAFLKQRKVGPNSKIKKILGEKIMKLGRIVYINSPFYNDINGTIPLIKLFQKDLRKNKKEAQITTRLNKIMTAWTMMFLEEKINEMK